MISEATIRRVYEHRQPSDGLRVLVDGLWPRGLSRSAADLDLWCKEIAPSAELRRWYGHMPSRWPEFQRRYRIELIDPPHASALEHLRNLATHQQLTLLTATREVATSHAVVIRRCLGGDAS